MATQFPETIGVPQMPESLAEPFIDPIEVQIHQSINKLIFLLNQRRVHLLATLRDRREEMRADLVARQEIGEELVGAKTLLEGQIKHNMLHSMQQRLVGEMEAKVAELHLNAPQAQELRFLCNTQDLEEHISRLGEINQHEIPPIPPMPVFLPIPPIPPTPVIPNYSAFQQPIVAVGKQGSVRGAFNNPRGVTIEPESGHIYVADMNNSRIQIFSQEGHHLNIFGDRHLKSPWGILIHEDNIYVTDLGQHNIFLVKLPELTMIKRVGKRGSGGEEFKYPRQPAISPNLHLYVPDCLNDRLQILTTNLVFKDSLRHKTMKRPVDVKFTKSEMFVLSWCDNLCIHVFTLSGEKSRSLLTRGRGMQVEEAYFFCLDGYNNIVISDYYADKIKVFSPEGELLHTIGHTKPNGLSIINNSKLVCTSDSANGLKILSA
ncbi:PEP-CTERM domain protein [Oopsacas minuta]|uniref:PEP-CTERM domain protein n=1 Tax=Oopsacas minuta TaxID=111878 RepID=A0AAV7JJI5_9METZ|nr:PEP-CTERM domain protein [Oopsacas minuta]